MLKLRELLIGAPSKERFALLVDVFAQWPASSEREVGLRYAEEHLADWPKALRHIDAEWGWPTFPLGEPVCGFGLARSFDAPIRGLVMYQGRTQLAELPQSKALEGLTHLRLTSERGEALSPRSFRMLTQMPQLSQLTHLSLECGMEHFNHRDMERATSLSQLTHLTLKPPMMLNNLPLWMQSPHLTHLTHLTLGSCDDPQALRFLQQAPWLTHLQSLSLGELPFSVEALASFLCAPQLQSLRALSFKAIHLQGSDYITHLAQEQALPQLKALEMEQGSFSPQGLKALSQAAFAPTLESLSLGQSELWIGAVEALFEENSFSSLHTLRLEDTELDQNDLEQLAKTPCLGLLQVLDLSENMLHEEAFERLVHSQHLAQLKELSLAGCAMEEESIRALGEASFLPQLEKLDLSGQTLGAGLCEAFSKQTPARLTHLSLADTSLSPDSSEESLSFLNAHTLPSLEHLDLSGSKSLKAEALAPLFEGPLYGQLRSLYLPLFTAGVALTQALTQTPRERPLLSCNHFEGKVYIPKQLKWQGFTKLTQMLVDCEHIPPHTKRSFLRMVNSTTLQELARKRGLSTTRHREQLIPQLARAIQW